jgi:proteasome activator subunit 4
MAQDGMPAAASPALTPFEPAATPAKFSRLGDYLSAPLGRPGAFKKPKTYLAGSKALDSLAKLILSTEHFFHPTNSGAWTADVSCRSLARPRLTSAAAQRLH